MNLTEGNHTLVTPAFSGSADEIMIAARAWLDIVGNLRGLEAQVTSFENRASIIEHLSREVASLQTSLTNASATLTTTDNIPSLKQDLPGEAEVQLDRQASPIKPKFESLGDKLKRFNEAC